jgi:hypothetical protein
MRSAAVNAVPKPQANKTTIESSSRRYLTNTQHETSSWAWPAVHVFQMMTPSMARSQIGLLVTVVLLTTQGANAQSCDSTTSGGVKRTALVLIGSVGDERMRDGALRGECSSSLIRSPLSLSPAKTLPGWKPRILWPSVAGTWNSAMPLTMNDGSMWAGRGLSTILSGGVRLDKSHATLILAPEITFSQNRGFPIVPSGDPNRSSFASPWHNLPQSADLPIRFGDQPFALVTFGQSAADLHAANVSAGFTTENQWWGPGIRNAIVMSNNAPGFPQIYFRTASPWQTRFGNVEARWELGLLSKSRFFDLGPGSGYRALSAGVVTLRTAFDSGLTVGAARAVYAHIDRVDGLSTHWMDVFWRWNQHGNVGVTPGHPTDQIASLFFQWNVPESGFQTYAEWARLIPPRSLRDLIVDPQTTQGFTAGLQWLNQLQSNRFLRLQGEVTTLEQTPPFAGAPVPTYYTSHISRQGYTQRGQVIGAAIGPGGSSQFIGVDLIHGLRSTGLELGRIRWEDESYYQQITGAFSYRHHDVSVFVGLRGSSRMFGNDIAGEIIWTQRDNFLFQSADLLNYDSAFDMKNLTLKFSIAPVH